MRWLLAKDLRILRRSPFLVAVLVVYPVVVALLIGFALSRGPERPEVAFVDEVPRGEEFMIGGQRFDLLSARSEVFKRIDAIEADSREEAERMVREGKALGALIIPRDTVQKLESQFHRPEVEVLVNEEDPLKARLVDDTITSLLSEANQQLSRAFSEVNLSYLDLVLRGGTVAAFGREFNVLGLRSSERLMRAARDRLPPGSRERRGLDRVIRFMTLARRNFDLTDEVLAAVRQPIKVKKEVLSGSRVPLTTFAAAIAVAVSLMFVTVLLTAGALALEREENTYGRLVRGLVSRTGLVVEKIALAVVCSVPITLVMLLGLGIFIPLEWGRFGFWLIGLTVAATAFAALGTTIGGLAREVPAASVMTFTLLLPVAFLALVPSGIVSEALFDITRAVSAMFPFKPALNAMNAALYDKGGLLVPLLHLAGLTLVFGAGGRLAVRRFA